ncbi:MAG: DUF721 domain-containing protein [Acidobacteria bacterium]|nr:DUF721 domain-containing protein [Acidobacteriota bacterium]
MERAGKTLGKLRIQAVNIAGVKSYHLAPKAWSTAVGKTIAAHSQVVFLDGKRLIVEAEDAIWVAQLRSLEGQILDRISRVVGPGMITTLEFRVAAPKRLPQMAAAARVAGLATSASLDEADTIADPVMRRLYMTSRRKATA